MPGRKKILMFCLLDRFSMRRNVGVVLNQMQSKMSCSCFTNIPDAVFCWKTTSESHLGFSHGIRDSDIQSFHRRSTAEMLRVKYWSYFTNRIRLILRTLQLIKTRDFTAANMGIYCKICSMFNYFSPIKFNLMFIQFPGWIQTSFRPDLHYPTSEW